MNEVLFLRPYMFMRENTASDDGLRENTVGFCRMFLFMEKEIKERKYKANKLYRLTTVRCYVSKLELLHLLDERNYNLLNQSRH